MSAPEDNTRPLSVAELLARNGTIGSPPVGRRRRRKRRNDDGVSVAELTGEIPVVRTGEIPVVADEEYYDEGDEGEEGDEGDEVYADEEYVSDGEYVSEGYVAEGEYVSGEYVGTDYAATENATEGYEAEESAAAQYLTADSPAQSESTAPVPESSEMVIVYTSAEEQAPVGDSVTDYVADPVAYASEDAAADQVDYTVYEDYEDYEEAAEFEEPGEPEEPEAPPLSSNPLPRRGQGPELSHDPRPQRRASDAEQMAYDPVDESVSLADLVEEHAVDAEELRSYLRASEGTLFSGGTVADDLARRGEFVESDLDSEADSYDDDLEAVEDAPGRGSRRFAGALGNGVVALLQSLLAVVFGAGLFIAFDQLWRWNNLVALILTVIVVVSLAAAVRLLRKTEDIVSTLTAVAVGLLVTLGPLALQN